MAQLAVTAPLVKIDVERRLIIARAAAEEPDRSNEIMDYETAKPAFRKWSDSYASNRIIGAEMSKGNVRVMHGRAVAGKVVDMAFNDADRAVDVVLKIDDDNEWKKCLAGNYTGLSIGGGYARKWQDNGLTRYTPDVREISLVDTPCIPSARIVELVKANGLVSRMELRGRQPRSFAELAASTPRTFAQMAKAYNPQEARNHGKWTAGGAQTGRAGTGRPGMGRPKPNSKGGGKTNVTGTAVAGATVGALSGGAMSPFLNAENVRHAAQGFDPAMYGGRSGRNEQSSAKASQFERNKLAARLRRDKMLREAAKEQARKHRTMAGGGAGSTPESKHAARGEELAAAAHRKVMEEAANAGGDMKQAKVDADAMADRVRRFHARKGGMKGAGAAFTGAARRAQGEASWGLKTAVRMMLARGLATQTHVSSNPKLRAALAVGGALLGGGLTGYRAYRHNQAVDAQRKAAGQGKKGH